MKHQTNPIIDLRYQFEKVRNAIISKQESDEVMAHSMLNIIDQTFQETAEFLAHHDQSWECDLEVIHHAIERLSNHMEHRNLDEMDAKIYLDYLENKTKYFLGVADEILGVTKTESTPDEFNPMGLFATDSENDFIIPSSA